MSWRMTAMLLTRRMVLAAAAAASLVPAARADEQKTIVVELFTSQGCSSCPPADEYMHELTARPGVLALSMNVDIWDYLGWKDSLGSHENTLRQQAYARRMPQRQVYTPQSIVDGMMDVVGSRKGQVDAAIDSRRATTGPRLALALDGADLAITVDAAPDYAGPQATVWLMRKLSRAEVDIGAGENAGRKITYVNVVRAISGIGSWKGEALTLRVPRRDSMAPPHDGYAVLVQAEGEGEILAAGSIEDPSLTAIR